MNRRQLFGWLSALPFVVATPMLFESLPLYGCGVETESGVVIEPGGLILWAGTMVTYPHVSARWGEITQFCVLDTNTVYLDMHYRPKLPEWF